MYMLMTQLYTMVWLREAVVFQQIDKVRWSHIEVYVLKVQQ